MWWRHLGIVQWPRVFNTNLSQLANVTWLMKCLPHWILLHQTKQEFFAWPWWDLNLTRRDIKKSSNFTSFQPDLVAQPANRPSILLNTTRKSQTRQKLLKFSREAKRTGGPTQAAGTALWTRGLQLESRNRIRAPHEVYRPRVIPRSREFRARITRVARNRKINLRLKVQPLQWIWHSLRLRGLILGSIRRKF